MAMITLSHGAVRPASGTSLLSAIAAIFTRMVTAREHEAKLYVNACLLTLDDETLARHGFERHALEHEGSSQIIRL